MNKVDSNGFLISCGPSAFVETTADRSDSATTDRPSGKPTSRVLPEDTGILYEGKEKIQGKK